MRITVLSTGGTIEKTYSELDGTLRNDRSVLDEILGSLRLPDLFIRHVELMHKDSLEMSQEDRQVIVDAVRRDAESSDAVIILHGTDTLSVTGELLYEALGGKLEVPVILTGAMRPYEFRDSDALQNVTEALFAARVVKAGVYVVMHNRALQFPGVEKDRRTLTFTRTDS